METRVSLERRPGDQDLPTQVGIESVQTTVKCCLHMNKAMLQEMSTEALSLSSLRCETCELTRLHVPDFASHCEVSIRGGDSLRRVLLTASSLFEGRLTITGSGESLAYGRIGDDNNSKSRMTYIVREHDGQLLWLTTRANSLDYRFDKRDKRIVWCAFWQMKTPLHFEHVPQFAIDLKVI